ncbi:fibrinogen-like YCDxxxxGGGW domain-containing protein [Nannocystis bainbridge]|uniref:Fibrinogen-like YCDxxxxGGGW domain-containing protein n=1 Tax=Nannocystis bainbridge TaxID=2995303 RepID=A0ABT5E0V6_9BACT|nr:fibrinogen-like YCDxxxxGGGW domain-containing protein [Nannocystis bainbridge]MDC0718337.1 fibrinogen-like YCDxxxxGGGW domain-containing protein [Nannocystis bainbridge]
MSFKTCLFVTALALPGLLLGCGDPAPGGTTGGTDDTTDTGSSSGPGTSLTEPTTTESVMTSDTLTTNTTDVPDGCGDGVKNGEESDIDCGGTCSPCGGGLACDEDVDCSSDNCDAGTCVALPASCMQLLDAKPDLPSGTYPLDPDGDGTAADFYCDMDPESPGWTQVFAAGGEGTWTPEVEGACGDLGAMMGPFGMGDVLLLATTAAAVPHKQLRVVAEAVVMDSWDAFNGEQLLIKLDDVDIFSHLCDSASPFSCNQDEDACGSGGVGDGVLPIATDPATHEGDAIALSFTSNLDEPIEDESWGIRDVAVFVK